MSPKKLIAEPGGVPGRPSLKGKKIKVVVEPGKPAETSLTGVVTFDGKQHAELEYKAGHAVVTVVKPFVYEVVEDEKE